MVKLSDLLRGLVESGGIPQEIEQEIVTTSKQEQSAIRKAFREECELRLLNPKISLGKPSRIRIPVKVLPGCPVEIKHVEVEASREQIDEALLLASHRDDLEKVAEGGLGLEKLYGKLMSQDLKILNNQSEPDASDIRSVAEWAQIHLSRLNDTAQAIIRGILWVKRDVMGAYYCPPSARIDLYWAVIGLLARLRGWKIQDLVVKVLAHEWAHAYTQLGVDVDGEYWPVEDYERVDRAVVEGLAQYYTHRVLERLSGKNDNLYAGAFSVYEDLLEYQPPVYQTHCGWIADYTPETVRYAMLGLRRNRETKLEQFERRLSEAQNYFNFSRNVAT